MPRSELIRKIHQLRNVTPSASWVETTRGLILAEIRRQENPQPKVSVMAAQPRQQAETAAGWNGWHIVRGLFGQPAFSIAAAFMLVMVSSLTVNAAHYSLPGEPLYRMKLAFERTQLALVSDATRKAELKVEFARNRVKELERLVDQRAPGGSTSREVNQVVASFTSEMASVQSELRQNPVDRRTVFQIAVSVDRAGSELAAKLGVPTYASSTPAQPEVAVAVQQALAAAESTSLSALQSVISAPQSTTTNSTLPAGEIGRYLSEKVQALRTEAGHAAGSGVATSTAGTFAAIFTSLDGAQQDISGENFSAALSKITAVREQLTVLKISGSTSSSVPADPESSVLPSAGPDSATEDAGGAQSTTTVPIGTAPALNDKSGSGVAGETAKDATP
ncbi:MAG: DUF5667 domain-containing protein [Patescibacteria group bacterium]|nr:DUF5667 domain-containing protein [Patescibacteria group bacterium]